MSVIKANYKMPLVVDGEESELWSIQDSDDQMVCDGMMKKEAEELCTILNTHFQHLELDNDAVTEAQMQEAYAKDQLKDALKKIEELQNLRAADAETLKSLGSSPAELVDNGVCGLCGLNHLRTAIGSRCGSACGGIVIPVNLLNSHFAKKEELPVGGACCDCGKPYRSEDIGNCCHVARCPGMIKAITSCNPTKDTPPTPDQAETDRVAVEYYQSGRKLEVQAWVVGDWTDQPEPNFSSRYPWRIKPSKRRVVVEIWKTQMGDVVSRISDGNPYIAGFKLLGTIEGEEEV